MLQNEKFDYLNLKADILKAVANPIRLCILSSLINLEECNVSELQMKTEKAQSTISQHLRVLKQGGIVEGIRNGNEVNYVIINSEIENFLKDFLSDIINE